MSATTVNDPNPTATAKQIKLDDLIPLFGGGIVIAAIAILACALANAIAIAGYANYAGDGQIVWPPGVVIAFGVFSIAVSVVVGRWLLSMRRWIGINSAPEDAEMVRRKRRSYTIAAATTYLLLTPFIWLMVVAMANTPM